MRYYQGQKCAAQLRLRHVLAAVFRQQKFNLICKPLSGNVARPVDIPTLQDNRVFQSLKVNFFPKKAQKTLADLFA